MFEVVEKRAGDIGARVAMVGLQLVLNDDEEVDEEALIPLTIWKWVEVQAEDTTTLVERWTFGETKVKQEALRLAALFD